MEVEESTTHLKTTATGKISSNLFLLLFYLHLLVAAVLTIFLTIRGLVFSSRFNHHHHHFHPLHWYPPLLTSSACAAITAFSWHAATRCNPSKTIKAAFWLSPLLTFGAGILLLAIGSASGLATAAFVLIFALTQSLYACWIVPRLDYTTKILTVSLSTPPSHTPSLFVAVSLITGTTYSCFSLSGIGGATATWTRFDPLFIFVILLSLAWTMHVIKNVLHVTISRVSYTYFAHALEVGTRVAFKDTLKYSMGSVCIGSVLVPVLSVFRGLARAMNVASGDTDEFMFSCTNCYSGVAGRLVTYGNRWGFVHVGAYGKGFVQASMDTWEMFRRVGMESLIDSDLTGSFCFLCGVAGGSLCTLVGGSWALAVGSGHATEVSIYAFLIGYFMSRIAMSSPQACVSAYHVAFAENPQSLRFDSTIPDRIRELQRSQV
ncbi:Choline transporter-like [Macleaya cordata]|uniref:Choline transporter-like protein n=1 Tax=Macleaya cordata TaxID=56857 RepID=A0A200R165_MACCD|nr:Choline transporter-like [Macleaya cordata]